MTDQTQETKTEAQATETSTEISAEYASDFFSDQSGGATADTPSTEKAEASDTSEDESNISKNIDGGTDEADTQKSGDQTEAANIESKEVEKPTRQNKRAERKIGQLTKRAKTSEEALEVANAKLAKYEAKEAPKDEKPKLEDYDSHDEWDDAKDEWEAEKEESRKTPSEEGKQDVDNRASEIAEANGVTVHEVEEVRENFIDILSDGKDQFKDFTKKTKDMDLSLKLARELGDSAVGHELLYHLSSNKEAFDKLNSITSERKLAREVVRLEASVAANEGATKTVKVSKASAPMPDTGNAGGGASGVDDLSMDDYAAGFWKNA